MRFPIGNNSIDVTPLGDSALKIEWGNQPRLIRAFCRIFTEQSIPGVRDIVPAYKSVVVHFDPDAASSNDCHREELIESIRNRLRQGLNEQDREAKVIEIPVLYDGEDLEAISSYTGLTSNELIDRHRKASYRVRMIGFMPGFPYLEGLDDTIAMPRREVPRTIVPAGSVGIGGKQTGIYPFDSPGGWNLLGRTPVALFSPERSSPSWLAMGDVVNFRAIESSEFENIQRRQKIESLTESRASVEGVPLFEVIHPGLQTTIQDLGRWGRQAVGVTPGGVMDRDSARLANWLVGNRESTPLLEMAIVGPQLKALGDLKIAVVGAHSNLPAGRPLRIAAGEVIDLKQLTKGARSYLALGGGFVSDQVLGGQGTDLKAGFGGHQGRALTKGDQLLGTSTRQENDSLHHRNWFATTEKLVTEESEGRIRFLRGPQSELFSDSAWQSLCSESFAISSQSDRMGIRLNGKLPTENQSDMPSEPTVIGAIQVPPSGSPIVLMADRQTVGGYPVIGVVVTVDLPKLAQLRPGEEIRFVEITLEEADRLLADRKRNIKMLEVGIKQTVGNNKVAAITKPFENIVSEASKEIDLNGDAGEGVGNDEEFIPLLTSVNIACGAHAGGDATMRRAVQIAVESNVAIGAHPGLPDRKNFGRKEISLQPTEAHDLVLEQIKRLQTIADEFEVDLQHVKPHGALYHMAAREAGLAKAIAKAVVASKGPRWLLGPPGTELETAARNANLHFAAEAFADRAYDASGNLVARTEPKALLTDSVQVVRQACSFVLEGIIDSRSTPPEILPDQLSSDQQGAEGRGITTVALKSAFKPKTLCLHGDTPQAVSLAQAVREGLQKANIRVRRFGSC